MSSLASKEDVLRLDAKIEASKAEILKWMFTTALAQVGAIVALLRVLY